MARRSIDELAGRLAGRPRPGGGPSLTAEEAAVLLREAGVPELLDELAVAERVVRAADSFHTVALFFVEGSDEQRYILDVLARPPA